MIYTVTLNPSIDYVMYVPEYTNGVINRSDREMMTVGGKGINVSAVLKSLGHKSTALGFTAGQTGKIIEEMIAVQGISSEFVTVNNGFTRINVKLKSGIETDVNGSGPEIDADSLNELYSKLSNLVEGDFLVLAGSVPKGMSADTYANIMKSIEDKGVKTVVDATGDLLTLTLKHKPFLIKPNNFELSEIFGKELTREADIIECAKSLQSMGGQNVLVSLGADGAILVCSDGKVLKKAAPHGKVINTTGSGDSTVAGFIAGYVSKKDFQYALSLGVCAGSATAFSETLATGEEIMSLM